MKKKMKHFFILCLIMIFSSASQGESQSDFKDKIVGGVPINSPGYFVSLVDSSVGADGRVEYYPACGGSLIRKDQIFVVLTAAHCVENLTTKLFVTMKPSFSSEVNKDTLVPIKAIVVHPGYDKNLIINDLALLILDETSPLLQDSTITTITVHADPVEFAGRELTAIGFGNASSYGDLFLDQMQSVVLNEVLLSECQQSGPDYQTVDQRQICAGNKKQGKKDTCYGDSGGPLIVETATGPKQIGIVSLGVDCAQEVPGVYTRPSAFSVWIQQQVDLFTPNNVRIYTAAEMKTFSNAYCYAHNPSASDSAEETDYTKEMQALFLLDNAEYKVATQIPDPNEMRLPLDTCAFNLPSGEAVARSVSLKNNVEETGYDYEHIVTVGEQIFASSSPLKMEYKLSCIKMDESARILTSVNEDHSIVIQVASEAGHLKLYHSHEELLDELPPGHKEVQSCIFNESAVKFYSSADDERFFAKLTGPVFAYSYNKFYELSPERDDAVVPQILISITPDGTNPFAGKMTLTNNTKVDLHSWQLECI
ncbi:MAG: trypsin-like serine protease, partial [Bdellovibrionota bacterium]